MPSTALKDRSRWADLPWLALPAALLAAVAQGRSPSDGLARCYRNVEAAKYYLSIKDDESARHVAGELAASRCTEDPRFDRQVAALRYKTNEPTLFTPKSGFRLVPYFGLFIFGQAATKDTGQVAGLYGNWSDAFRLLEIQGEHLQLGTRTGTDIAQESAAGFLTLTVGTRGRIRFGGAYSLSTDATLPTGYSLSAGGGIVGETAQLGVDLFFSRYPLPSGLDHTLLQISPLASARWKDWSLSLRGHFIFPLGIQDASLTTAFSGQSFLGSTELEIRRAIAPWTLGASGFYGNQVLAVRNNGFLIMRSLEDYRGGLSLSVSVALSASVTLKASGSLQWADNKAMATSYEVRSGLALVEIII